MGRVRQCSRGHAITDEGAYALGRLLPCGCPINSPEARRAEGMTALPLDDTGRDHVLRMAREALIASTDVIRPGDEPYPGWSMVLAERILFAIETGDTDGP